MTVALLIAGGYILAGLIIGPLATRCSARARGRAGEWEADAVGFTALWPIGAIYLAYYMLAKAGGSGFARKVYLPKGMR